MNVLRQALIDVIKRRLLEYGVPGQKWGQNKEKKGNKRKSAKWSKGVDDNFASAIASLKKSAAKRAGGDIAVNAPYKTGRQIGMLRRRYGA